MRVLILLALGVITCGCASSRNPYASAEVPESYLKALAKERGVSQDEARQILMEARSNGVPDRVAETTRLVTSRGATLPKNPHPAGQEPR